MTAMYVKGTRLYGLYAVVIVFAFTRGIYCNDCSSFSDSCSECITKPGCAWCNNQTYQEARCGTEDQLRDNGCDLIENPKTNLTFTMDEELADGVYRSDEDDELIASAIQIKPQQVHLRIRQGETERIEVKVRQAQNYPVDLYYLMDLSGSMRDDLGNLKVIASDIADQLRRITRRGRLGFGSFVDKPIVPFINITESAIDQPCTGPGAIPCEKTYSFRNVLPLNETLNLFAEKVGQVDSSSNLDGPEGLFDAMMQAAVCSDEIGWRPNARRLLLATTDANCHIQGDGKIGRVFTPNDGLCHMTGNEYKESHIYDYPSVAFLNQKLVQNNIIPIFAVTIDWLTQYRHLSGLIQGAFTTGLTATSSNIVNVIQDSYDTITGRVELVHEGTPPNIGVAISANCPGNDADGQACSVGLGEEVSFDVDITARECGEGSSTHSFQVYPVGLDDRLNVTVEVICECSCEDTREPNSTYCSDGNGTLVCGTCECNPGRYGEFCGCSGFLADDLADTCNPRNQTGVPCSGRGECICGECACDTSEDASVSGKFCECSDKRCPVYDDEICGGPTRGSCTCKDGRFNECECLPGYSGDACDCLTLKEPCIAPQTGLVCNAEGTCDCGRCKCKSTKFYGEHCGQCATCTACHIHINCIRCEIFEEGPALEDCNMCTQDIREATVETPNRNSTSGYEVCSYRNSDNCTVTYLVRENDDETYQIFVEPLPVCPIFVGEPFPVVPVIIGIIAGILLLGLLLILLFRLYTYFLDKKELEQLLKEQANADFQQGVNPLYKQSTQTFKNPMFGKS